MIQAADFHGSWRKCGAAKVLTKKICHDLLFSTFGLQIQPTFSFDSSSTCKSSGARKWATLFFPVDANSHVVTTLQRSTYRKIQAKELGNNFRAVTEIVEVSLDDLLSKMQPDSIVTKNHYVAINASDVNFTNGKYTPDVKPYVTHIVSKELSL